MSVDEASASGSSEKHRKQTGRRWVVSLDGKAKQVRAYRVGAIRGPAAAAIPDGKFAPDVVADL